MKKFIHILNIIMGAVAGLFVGYVMIMFLNHKMNPSLYAYYSAPWYTGILVYGVLTLVVLVFGIVIKAILKLYIKKSERKVSRLP